MPTFSSRTGAMLVLVCLTFSGPAAAQTSSAPNELDAFMEKVLARREVNRQTLKQYVLDETEAFELLGPGRDPLYRQKREFTWYVRDGIQVRSPVRFDGVTVGESDRREYEDRWLRRERERLDRARSKEGKPPEPEQQEPDPATGAMPLATPRFVSEAYFMDFKFEPGNYYLAGREQLEGKEVVKVEYYPQRMFNDKDNDKDKPEPGAKAERERQRERRRETELENRIERQMNKTALITLWIDPAENQIVKYTFDNVWLDFLPGGWLVRVDDIGASMTMGQPFPGVWLPRAINIKAGVSLANGSYDAAYVRTFDGYRQADVKSTIRVPKAPASPAEPEVDDLESAFHGQLPAGPVAGQPHPSSARKALVTGVGPARGAGRPRPAPPARVDVETHSEGSGPLVAEAALRANQSPVETIGEIRVHGNATLLDSDVIALAGIAVGQPLQENGVAEIEHRLKESGRFESVEVRKRYRSLTVTNDVAIVLVVHERPGVASIGTEGKTTSGGPFSRLRHRLMFLPILSYADGYAFTYGGRVSTLDLLGIGERLSVPLTWGGTRRAALEFERAFDRGPVSRVETSIAIWNRENPHFEIREQRVEWNARAERQFASFVRAGVDTSRSTVDFGTIDDELWTFGADVTLDTRGDPAFPRNAVLMRAGWTALNIDGRGSRINRYVADARGYVGVIGQLVVAGRVQYTAADARLPDYERLLLGGSPTVRGFEAGQFIGDRMFVTSAELRLPLTSVLNSAKLGVTAFLDAGRAYDFGTRFDDAEWRRGAGAGVFLIAPLVKINLDVAHGLKTGSTRVHLTTGFMF